jgi:'Paired box' domain
MLWRRGKAYPPELRERIFIQADAGLTVGAIARTLLVSVSYVSKVLSRREKTGETAARGRSAVILFPGCMTTRSASKSVCKSSQPAH